MSVVYLTVCMGCRRPCKKVNMVFGVRNCEPGKWNAEVLCMMKTFFFFLWLNPNWFGFRWRKTTGKPRKLEEWHVYLPYLFIWIQPNWINVASDSSFKKDRFLRNDPKPRPKIMEAYCGNVNAIDDYSTSWRLHQPKENLDKSLFYTTSSTNYTNLVSPSNVESNPFKNQRGIWTISNLFTVFK